MNPTNKIIGARIRKIRMDNNMTLEMFGEQIGKASKGLVSRWESGVNLPNKERLDTIAKLGKITTEELTALSVENIMEDISKTFSALRKNLETKIGIHIYDYSHQNTQYESISNLKLYDDDGVLTFNGRYPEWVCYTLYGTLYSLKNKMLKIMPIDFDIYLYCSSVELSDDELKELIIDGEDVLPAIVNEYQINFEDAKDYSECVKLIFSENHSTTFDEILDKSVKSYDLYLNLDNIFGLENAPLTEVSFYDDSIIQEEAINEELYPYEVTEKLAAAPGLPNGYAYDSDYNQTFTLYSDRKIKKRYDIASQVIGDSMEPQYHDGDVVLIQKGYDNINGAIYAVDYDGKTYIKKVYLEDNHFRLVSLNDKYEDILIDLPVDEDLYFNIVGKVVDSFTPVEL